MDAYVFACFAHWMVERRVNDPSVKSAHSLRPYTIPLAAIKGLEIKKTLGSWIPSLNCLIPCPYQG
jgi:hypothetical protein